MNKKVKYIVTAAMIAALYATLTIVLWPISSGPVQFRISEILTVLPFFTSAAIPGLFIGCVIGNMMSNPVDILVGSLATLLAAFLSSKMPKKWLVPLPPIICNGIIVGLELHFVQNAPLLLTVGTVALGEAVVCYAGGLPLMFALDKIKHKLF